MDDEAKPLDTPDALLNAIGANLISKEGVDADLAAILTTHLIKAAPADP